MAPLDSRLRGGVETTILNARADAERGAEVALAALAVGEDMPHAGLDAESRTLRNQLRARARILGESGGVKGGLRPLIEEVAYEQWHRMLFARFLAENDLLMHPSGVAVTLDECEELASEEGEPDAWTLAALYGAAMLPGIFRVDDPSHRVRLAPDGRAALERRLAELPRSFFTSDDGLGWAYQFWQGARKEAVNQSDRKVGGADMAAVTQWFTEDYMVRYLLENSLGAWWAVLHPESALVAEFTYLRRTSDGSPAASRFDGWPKRVAEITCMDPCCGSGHFLEALHRMLVRMRMEEEGLDPIAASDAVLRDNLFGLELDPRCVQIAAFTLALSAWRIGGSYRELPRLNLACSGIPVQGQLDEWLALARGDANAELPLRAFHALFRQAPHVGSLIDPSRADLDAHLFGVSTEAVAAMVDRALSREQADPAAVVFGATARGAEQAARLLGRQYTLVATNVPYLGRRDQDERLREFCLSFYPDAEADLATAFIERCLSFSEEQGTTAVVTPQNWFSQVAYESLRAKLLRQVEWDHLARLGSRAFRTISGEVVNVALLVLTRKRPEAQHTVSGVDVTGAKGADSKAECLQTAPLVSVAQADLRAAPQSRVSLVSHSGVGLLSQYADSVQGTATGDGPRFVRFFWEQPLPRGYWKLTQSTVSMTTPYGGREMVTWWDDRLGRLPFGPGGRAQGYAAFGKFGVAVSQIGDLPCTLYTGETFDMNCAVLVPKRAEDLPAVWAYCSSPEYSRAVRHLDGKLNVTNATLAKVRFDAEHWRQVAEANGDLPEPSSNDPTQWLFDGNPSTATLPLQVATARLLGYRWPRQVRDSLDDSADADGVACVPAVAGEDALAERLRGLLTVSYGASWTAALLDKLLADVGAGRQSLETWLRDGFFEDHCRVFANRPFIWHIWDRRPDGFAAFVNYHKLDGALLERLIYTYLGAWIGTQRAAMEANTPGAEGRLAAALDLQQRLKLIREGETPHDIYVRWKPLHQQPVGWEPDPDDGVRLNIRPFVEAGVLRRKVNVNWNKDRGANPDGSERINDRHLTLAEKRAARAAHGVPA